MCGGAAHKLDVMTFLRSHADTELLLSSPYVVCVPIKLRANLKQTVDESVKGSANRMCFFPSSGLEPMN